MNRRQLILTSTAGVAVLGVSGGMWHLRQPDGRLVKTLEPYRHPESLVLRSVLPAYSNLDSVVNELSVRGVLDQTMQVDVDTLKARFQTDPILFPEGMWIMPESEGLLYLAAHLCGA